MWLEPEGLNSSLVYPNGISSAFPLDVQTELVRSMEGLEHAEIVQPAYDVEYDYVDPRSLSHALEVRQCAGLYLAGQIIGTTGYEEAAALGTMAGANAALAALGRPPLVLRRDEAYIGVLVDDLVRRGTMEPYRMFTSRAEYRLLLRADNADQRLTERGYEAGLVGDERRAQLRKKEAAISAGLASLRAFQLPNDAWAARGFGVKPNGQLRSAEEILRVPDAAIADVEVAMAEEARGWRGGAPPDGPPLPALGKEAVEVGVKYDKYLERQAKEVRRIEQHAMARLPDDLDYAALPCLSAEEVEKLTAARPATLHDAGLIPGITPKAVGYLFGAIEQRRNKERLANKAKRDDAGRMQKLLENKLERFDESQPV